MARGLIVALCAVLSSGCCGYRARHRIPALDYFERYVIVDVGTPPRCALPKRRNTSGRMVPVGVAVPVWIRSVAATDVRKPVATGRVTLSVVTSFGDATPSATITPSVVTLKADGFAAQKILLTLKSSTEHFRILAEFADKAAPGRSYSPFIVAGTGVQGIVNVTGPGESTCESAQDHQKQ